MPRLLFADQVLQAAAQFRQRPLPEELALVYLDGLFLQVPGEEGVERAAVYVALGVTPAVGQVLGYWLLPSENARCCRACGIGA